jgi:hypothetical protein
MGSIPDEVVGYFNWPNSSSSIMGPAVDSASNRIEYQADNLTAICELII